jgi:hypothetical protein
LAEKDDDDDLDYLIEKNDNAHHCSSPPAKRIKLGKWFLRFKREMIDFVDCHLSCLMYI